MGIFRSESGPASFESCSMQNRTRGARFMTLARRALPWWLLCVAGQLHAARVTEVAPADLRAALRTDGLTVVQFTSPDPKCGYCRGQDSVFDAFAASQTSQATFARVQWTPWRPFPALEMSEPLYGIPNYYLFKSGRVVGEHSGKLTDPAKLSKLIADALEGKVDPRFDPAASKPLAAERAPVARAATSALSDADREALARLARRDLVREAFQRCAAANPAEAETYRSALSGWEGRHRPELAKGSLLMITRTTRADAAEMSAITEAQARRLKTEAPMSSPTPQGCSRLTSTLAE